MSYPTQKMLLNELQQISNNITSRAFQVVAHKYKIQYAVSQFHDFVAKYSAEATDEQITKVQAQAYRAIIEVVKEYEALFAQNMPQTWAQMALENHSSSTPTELCTISGRLKEITKHICESASEIFNPAAPQWLQYHILDLKCIQASFSKYKSDDNDPAAPLIRQRTNSISNFLKKYETETVGQGQRMFSAIPVNYQSWRLKHDDLDMKKDIGSGISAIVYYGIDKRTGQEVAIKKLKAKKLVGSKLQGFQREIAILATAQHPTLLKFIGATDSSPYCIVTEWMHNQSLYHDIHKYHKLDPTLRTIACFDIARGMKFLHSRQIIHRDLKTLNVLIDKDFHAKICDFGASRQVGQGDLMTKNVGTPHWMAPELLENGQNYTNKIDVYAYGILIWEILSCQLPYHGMDPTQIIAQVLVQDLRPQIPDNCPDGFKELMQACWARDPAKRPSFPEIVHIFKSGNIFIPGTDIDKLKEYMNDVFSKEPDDFVGENDKADDAPKENQQTEEQIIESLVKDGPPSQQNQLEKVWKVFSSIDKENKRELYAKGAAAFIKTMYNSEVAKTLRTFPSKSVDRENAKNIVSLIPTGNEAIDLDLIYFGCKNDCCDIVAMHALNQHLKIAFEACANNGVPKDSVEEVSKICISSLSSSDQMLVVSALRCLMKMKMAKNIPIETLKMHLQSKNETLKNAAHVAAAELALEGGELTIDLIDALTTKWIVDPLACAVIIAGCKHVNIARHLLSRLAFGAKAPPEISIRILMMAIEHKELHEEIKERLDELTKIITSQEISQAIEVLSSKI